MSTRVLKSELETTARRSGASSGAFKLTEFGPIPEDWYVAPLGTVMSNGRLGGNYPNQLTETALPLMKMGNISRGRFDVSKVEYVLSDVVPAEGHRLTKGDVLLNTRNTLDLVGKVAIWRDELPLAFFNSNLMRLEFDANHVASTEYANFALNASTSIALLRSLATGTTSVAAIYTRDLLALPFVLPPQSEQRAIAEALSDVEGLLGALDVLVAKKRAIKQATMQQLLTGKTRLPGFSGDWEARALGELVTFLSGGTPSRGAASYWSGEIPWISASSLRTFYVWRSDTNLTKEGVAAGSRMAPVGATLLLVRGSALHNEILAGLVTKPVCFNQDVKALVPNSLLVPQFLTFYLHGKADELLRLVSSAGNTAGVLDTKILKAFEILLPKKPEQEAISAALIDIDAEITALERRREKTHAIKQGMMQQLLTGRIRLVQPVTATTETATP
ncbi:MAG: restriction endonuclease subunit S [Xanthomonadaceae bacterium]|nr:restriction endonuclease subunit S [Xanthomonadaceae bacterium]ODU36354.1 MAG: hypothetical protein ABS97_00250 [Xanthomonadaceae bacterium SCN 69-320]